MILYQWAQQWGVPLAAVKHLESLLGYAPDPRTPATGLSEAAVQNNLLLEGSRKGVTLFRNNVGAGFIVDDAGNKSFIRWGLANESERVNKVLKSGDLIGWRTVTIQPHMVGWNIAQFVSREAKPGNWTYSASDHERAQLKWAEAVVAAGGDACFAIGEGTL